MGAMFRKTTIAPFRSAKIGHSEVGRVGCIMLELDWAACHGRVVKCKHRRYEHECKQERYRAGPAQHVLWS